MLFKTKNVITAAEYPR